MSPFQALYGFPPPMISELAIPVPEEEEAQNFLAAKQQILEHLKSNLLQAQNRIKRYADLKRVERVFEVVDMVYLKMAPYRLAAFGFRGALKLQNKYYGPFLIVQKIGNSAYKLQFPAHVQIHPVFHVSQLKKHIGPNSIPSPNLSMVNQDGTIKTGPAELLLHCSVSCVAVNGRSESESERSAPKTPRSSRPSAEKTTTPTSSSAASSAGDADALAAAADHHTKEEVAEAEPRLASRFAHLAPRWLRLMNIPRPATIPTPALAAARTPSRTLNPLNAHTFAAAAAQFAGEVAGTEVDAEAKDLAAAAVPFAAGTRGSADDLVRAADALSKAATGTPFAVQSMDLLVCTSCLVVIPEETETECLVRTTHEFVTAAQGSSMEDGARLFARAVDAFAAGKFRSVKVADTELCRMGRMLEHMARMAPDTEKKLAESRR
ncbi:uncharacterized protein [Aegilops tauschii subsp. strangulata]|uniref:uncharacterized protein n=1 Tax=Aegilops tauschii subsp. strangulata TaxID=200361 RepID=UPI003CC88122